MRSSMSHPTFFFEAHLFSGHTTGRVAPLLGMRPFPGLSSLLSLSLLVSGDLNKALGTDCETERRQLHHHDDGGELIGRVFDHLAELDRTRARRVAKAVGKDSQLGLDFGEGSFLAAHDPRLTSDADLLSVPYNDKERPLALANRQLPEGTKVGVRLNLNLLGRTKGRHAVQSVHSGTYSGKVVGYDGHVTVKNARFNVSQAARAAIASGRSSKTPMASVDGEIKHSGHSLEGIEVRFNPKTSHLFTRADNGWAVKSCDEATIHGHRAYCRGNIEYWHPHEAPAPLENLPTDATYKPTEISKAINQEYLPHDGSVHPLEQEAVGNLGHTSNPAVAGYVLRNGKMLNLDPENKGYRSVEHDLPGYCNVPGGDSSERVQEFMHHTGAARVQFDPVDGAHMISAVHPLTREQHSTISRHVYPGDSLEVEAVGRSGQPWSQFYHRNESVSAGTRGAVLDQLQLHTSINPLGKSVENRGQAVGTAGREAHIASRLNSGKSVLIQSHQLPGLLDYAHRTGKTFDLSRLSVPGTKIFDGHIGVERGDMPQIPKVHQPGFMQELTKDGIKVREESVDPRTLAPTQNQLDAKNSGQMLQGYREGTMGEKPIMVSKEGHVLDGHHRWVAAVAHAEDTPGFKMPVIRVHLPIRELLDRANDYNDRMGVTRKEFGKSVGGGYAAPSKEEESRFYNGGVIRGYRGGSGKFHPDRPMFFAMQPHHARWYAQKSDGVVAAAHVAIHKPARVKDVLDAAQAVGSDAKTIQEHSPYGGDNPLDHLYVPAVREELKRRGHDGVIDWDALGNEEVLAAVPLDHHQIAPAGIAKSAPPVSGFADLTGTVLLCAIDKRGGKQNLGLDFDAPESAPDSPPYAPSSASALPGASLPSHIAAHMKPSVDDEVNALEQGLLPPHRVSAEAYIKHRSKEWRIGDTMRYRSGQRYARGGYVPDTGEYPVSCVSGGLLRINHPEDSSKTVSMGEAERVTSSFNPDDARGAHIGAVAGALKHGKEVPFHVLEEYQKNLNDWAKRRGVPNPPAFQADLDAAYDRLPVELNYAVPTHHLTVDQYKRRLQFFGDFHSDRQAEQEHYNSVSNHLSDTPDHVLHFDNPWYQVQLEKRQRQNDNPAADSSSSGGSRDYRNQSQRQRDTRFSDLLQHQIHKAIDKRGGAQNLSLDSLLDAQERHHVEGAPWGHSVEQGHTAPTAEPPAPSGWHFPSKELQSSLANELDRHVAKLPSEHPLHQLVHRAKQAFATGDPLDEIHTPYSSLRETIRNENLRRIYQAQKPDSTPESRADISKYSKVTDALNRHVKQWHEEAFQPTKPAAHRAVEDWEKNVATRQEYNEHCAAFDHRGRELLQHTSGKHGSIDLENHISFLRTVPGGAVFTHNHPLGYDHPKWDHQALGHSFSQEDIGFSGNALLREIRAISPGHQHIMRPGRLGNRFTHDISNRIQASYNKHSPEVRKENWGKVNEGRVPLEQADTEHSHQVWSRVAAELGLDYQRIPHHHDPRSLHSVQR